MRVPLLGYSLIELMVAMSIGLFFTTGIFSLYVSGQREGQISQQLAQAQESARVALHFIGRDIHQAGFWGRYTGTPMVVGHALSVTSPPPADCLDEIDNGSLPDTRGRFRDVWSFRHTSTALPVMDCIEDIDPYTTLLSGNDVLSLKRVVARPDQARQKDRYYLASNNSKAVLFRGDETPPSSQSLPGMQIWEYQHRVYYLDQRDDIPRLRRLHLTATGMVAEPPLAEGIEAIIYQFGLDSDGDGRMDRQVANHALQASDWDSQRIVSVAVHVLARTLRPDPRYQNNNRYQLADQWVSGNGDGYRRVLLSAIYRVRNGVIVGESEAL